MVSGILRVLFGFIVGCFAAGMVKVGFVITPEELLSANEQQWLAAAQLTLFAATQTAVFAAPFALIAATIGEWQSIRGWTYYVITGIAIAAAGFAALYSSENVGQPTIVNRYALLAYFSAGIVGGFVYWLFAGRGAGGRGARQGGDRSSGDRGAGHRGAGPQRPVVPKGGPSKPVLPVRPTGSPAQHT